MKGHLRQSVGRAASGICGPPHINYVEHAAGPECAHCNNDQPDVRHVDPSEQLRPQNNPSSEAASKWRVIFDGGQGSGGLGRGGGGVMEGADLAGLDERAGSTRPDLLKRATPRPVDPR